MKKVFCSILVLAIALAAAMPLASSAWTYHYVTVSGAGNQDGTSYDNAFAGIQAGINAAASGDWVMVAAGVYPPIVSSNKYVIIVGDSAATTIIDGGNTNRCATLIADDADTGGKTALVNFTLRNGDVMSNYMAQEYEDCGAGARGGYLLNCIIENCRARYGGGVADATTECCIIRNCTAELGGGAHCSLLSTNHHYNTIFEKNHARQMVSAASAWKENAIMLFNCTVVANTTDSSELPGSVANGYLFNTLFYMNSGDGIREYDNEPNPCFVNYWAGDYRLRADSPYIDIGNSIYQDYEVLDNTDFLGHVRVQDGNGDGVAKIDYGVYETVIQGIVVTARAGDGGLVSPATSIIDSGGSVTLTADTNTYGRTVASWSTNGVVIASATNATLTLTNILSHTDVTVAFNLLDWYVDAATGNDNNTGDSWDDALKTIQAAIDRAVSGETIYVKPGTYGAIDVDGKRLAITGVEGAGTTFIDANKASRAVTLCDGAAITGFTICNGDLIKLSTLDSQGGGVWGGTIRDCVISNNVSVYGGGAAGATVDRCIVVGNMASEGGGLYECKVFNSLLHKNDALQGGGCKWGTATGCTIVNNRAVQNSATDSTILRNCILTSHGTERRKENLDAFLLGQENVSGNLRPTIGFPGGASFYSHICSVEPVLTNNGSIAANPCFVDAFNGDYRLRSSSPCLDTGSGDHVKPQYNKDLAGNDRVTGSAPDMGCFEGGVAGHVVSVRVEGDGVVSLRTAVVADSGSVSVTATPTGRTFLGWEKNGEPASDNTTITLSGIASDIVLIAKFEKKTIYVTTNGNDTNDGLSQATAKKTIQAAVNVARNGDKVLVGDGTYSGKVSTIGKSITIQSMNGADVTTITSTWHEGSRTTVVLGQSYAEPQSLLDGFTVTGGSAMSIRNWGGGVRYGRVQNCIIRNNYGWVGGGVAMAILSNCKLLENAALVAGGGGIFISVENCLIADNEVDSTLLEFLLGDNVRAPLMGVGGGLAGASANYCTIVGNTTKTYGGGIAGAGAENSIIDGNSSDLGNNNVYQPTFYSNLCLPDGSLTGNGCISDAPSFVNAAGGDYSLQGSSPCIDAADYFRSHFNQDLAGNRRVSGPATDMGCYEYQSNRPYDVWASNNVIYGLSEEATDGVANLFRFATDTASGPLTVPLLTLTKPTGGDAIVSPAAFTNAIQVLQVLATEDLTDWSPATLIPMIESPAGSGQWKADDGKDHSQLFFRLKAQELP